MEIIREIPPWPFVIVAALIAALVALYIRRTNRTEDAKDGFRKIIFNSLVGVYPNRTASSTETEIRINSSASNIDNAFQELRISIGNNRRVGESVAAYKEAAENYNDNSEAAFHMYPTMHNDGDTSPKAKVISHVENLLMLLR